MPLVAETTFNEIADGIYRIATHLDGFDAPMGIEFCQFLVNADEPLLVHTGMRQLFPDVAAAIARVVALSRLRWVTFGHVEGDECGAINDLLTVAVHAEVAFGTLGCLATVNDLAIRPPRPLADGETLDLGGRRLRQIPTPHVPHNWEAQVFYEEVTGTLFCGDLLGQAGRVPAVTADLDIVERAMSTAVTLTSASPGPAMAVTLRRLAELEPLTLAVMHGASFCGDGAAALRLLADVHGR